MKVNLTKANVGSIGGAIDLAKHIKKTELAGDKNRKERAVINQLISGLENILEKHEARKAKDY